MECSCIITSSDYDVEGPVRFCQTMVTAKKEHKCTECRQIISPGEKYQKVGGLWDGKYDHFKTCKSCLSLIDVFFDRRPCFGYAWEDFYNKYNYLNVKIPEKCISALAPSARARVCQMIEENLDDYDDDEDEDDWLEEDHE